MGELKLNLDLIESPFVLELKNEENLSITIDASEAIGGKGKGIRPMELLAGSLAGCMSIDILNILRKQRVEVKSYKVEILGGRVEAVPAKFSEIDLQFIVDKDVPIEKLANAAKLSHDKYCSVSASLDPGINIRITCRHEEITKKKSDRQS